MKIVVTGGAGAVGSFLCEKLLNAGHSVLCLDNLSTGRIENIEHLKSRKDFWFRNIDLKDKKECLTFLPDADLIYHLAGSVGVVLVDKKPLETLTNNLEIGKNVFEIAARHNIRVIFTSSSEVYGNGINPGQPFNENDSLIIGPSNKLRWGYASSKLTQEFLLRALSPKSTIVRLFNVVSPLHKKSYVIPSFVQSAIEHNPIKIYGDGNAKRCFIHVDDATEYLLRLAENSDTEGEIYNIGNPENEYSIKELAQRILKYFGDETKIEYIDPTDVFSGQHDDIDFRKPDIKKISIATNFIPSKTLEDILNDFTN